MTADELDAVAKYPPPLREHLLDLSSANSITKNSVSAQHSSYLGKTKKLVEMIVKRLDEDYPSVKDKTKATQSVPLEFVAKIVQDWYSEVGTIAHMSSCSLLFGSGMCECADVQLGCLTSFVCFSFFSMESAST